MQKFPKSGYNALPDTWYYSAGSMTLLQEFAFNMNTGNRSEALNFANGPKLMYGRSADRKGIRTATPRSLVRCHSQSYSGR